VGQRVYVTVTGVTADLIENTCWVGVYDAGGGASAYHEWKYVTTEGTSVIPLDLPLQQGSFEIRFVPQNSASAGHSAVSQTFSSVFEQDESVGIGDYLWTGEWDTNWGRMTLTQNGRDVTGNYEHDQGKIEGKVYGNVLFGKWGEDPTYSPDYNDAGLCIFSMSEDGKSFIGGWCYKYEYPSSWSSWSGNSQRLTEVLLVPVETPPVQQSSFIADSWAIPYLEKAQSYGLIPDVLKDADLTMPITRAEFAAVAVKTYENFTGTTVTPVASNPFTDTNNEDVLKAFNINAVNGTSATTYNPDSLLTRQDAATMLTRVEKRAYIPGWTLATDSNYTLNFTQPARFADDNDIGDHAGPSVYFMASMGIVNGTGNNMFSPTVTATRQEALIIAVRMVDKLKGETLDYT